VIGSKADPQTDVGPLIHEREAMRVAEWVEEAKQAGAQVLVGGESDGAFYWPTVLVDVPETATLYREEVFGPVMFVEPYTDFEAAIQAMNDTDYGLQAGVFTASMDKALHAVDLLDMGTVLVNDTSDYRIDAMPF